MTNTENKNDLPDVIWAWNTLTGNNDKGSWRKHLPNKNAICRKYIKATHPADDNNSPSDALSPSSDNTESLKQQAEPSDDLERGTNSADDLSLIDTVNIARDLVYRYDTGMAIGTATQEMVKCIQAVKSSADDAIGKENTENLTHATEHVKETPISSHIADMEALKFCAISRLQPSTKDQPETPGKPMVTEVADTLADNNSLTPADDERQRALDALDYAKIEINKTDGDLSDPAYDLWVCLDELMKYADVYRQALSTPPEHLRVISDMREALKDISGQMSVPFGLRIPMDNAISECDKILGDG